MDLSTVKPNSLDRTEWILFIGGFASSRCSSSMTECFAPWFNNHNVFVTCYGGFVSFRLLTPCAALYWDGYRPLAFDCCSSCRHSSHSSLRWHISSNHYTDISEQCVLVLMQLLPSVLLKNSNETVTRPFGLSYPLLPILMILCRNTFGWQELDNETHGFVVPWTRCSG